MFKPLAASLALLCVATFTGCSSTPKSPEQPRSIDYDHVYESRYVSPLELD